MGLTLAEKVWNEHVVVQEPGEPDLLYIDLHLVHEVTSPQAFDGLRDSGRVVRRPDLTVATEDHNVPTADIDQPIADPISARQVEVLRDKSQALESRLAELVTIARANEQLVVKFHDLTRRMLGAPNRQEAVMRLEQSLREDFDITHSKLVLFGPAATGIIANRFVSCMDAKDAGLGGEPVPRDRERLGPDLDDEVCEGLDRFWMPFLSRKGSNYYFGRHLASTLLGAGFRDVLPTVSYQTSSMCSQCFMTWWSLAGPSTGCDP